MRRHVQEKVFTPFLNTTAFVKEDRFRVFKENVRNKYLLWFFEKVRGYMQKTGYLEYVTLYSDSYTVDTCTLDLEKLDEQLVKNQDAIEAIYNDRVDTIVCGVDVMRKIMTGDPFKLGYREVHMEGQSNFGRYAACDPFSPVGYSPQPITYRGLKVLLVPWFEGILLLPKGEKNERY